MKINVKRSSRVVRSARVMQIESIFELPPSQRSEVAFTADVSYETKPWHIGLIVGPSGSGKTTIAREVFGDAIVTYGDWPVDRSIVDGFARGLSIAEITSALSSVGFSSPPNWLRPYLALSNGEQFRANVARALVDSRGLVVIDEFTSVVDRTVARVCSAAVAKAIRREEKRLVAVSCHYDIVEWLQPDWVYDTASHTFTWREVQRRPAIDLVIRRVRRAAWQLFKHHHYLDTTLSAAAYCFLATWKDRPVAFTGVISFPHAVRPAWREHRTVCLPDFQGVGIGNAMSAFVGSLFLATGKPYFSVTSNPAMVQSRLRSPLWRMTRGPSFASGVGESGQKSFSKTIAVNRITTSFEYIGPTRSSEARRFALM